MRAEAERSSLATNGHAPPHFRTFTVRNLDAWYGAFEVAPNDPLFLAPERARPGLVTQRAQPSFFVAAPIDAPSCGARPGQR